MFLIESRCFPKHSRNMSFYLLLLRHQNLPIIFSNSAHNDFGNKTHNMKYVSMAWRTDLMKTSLPSCERWEMLHPQIFLLNLSFSPWKTLRFPSLTIFDNPKYFFDFVGILTLSICEINYLSWNETLLLKKTVYLSKLIHCPKLSSYSCRMPLNISSYDSCFSK